jgi:opacity protein-like surface antigen
MTPAWLLGIFAAIMLAVAAVSAARLAAARPWRGGRGAALADIDVAHLLMAIAMAGMLASSLQTLPDGAWEVTFVVLLAWFAYRVARDAQVSGFRALAGGHCAPHLIHAASMLYMFLALTTPAAHGTGGMGGMAGSAGTLEVPLLAFVFTLLLAGYTIWDLDQLSGPGASGHYSLAAPRLAPVAVLVGVTSGGTAGGPDSPARGSTTGSGKTGPEERGPVPAPRGGGPANGQGRGVLAPWVAVSCRIAMGVTMAFMLVIMI